MKKTGKTMGLISFNVFYLIVFYINSWAWWHVPLMSALERKSSRQPGIDTLSKRGRGPNEFE